MPLANEHSGLSKSKSFRINRQAISEPIPSQSKFPRIEDCAHFHYETVDHGCIKLLFVDEASAKKGTRIPVVDDVSYSFSVKIACKGNSWIVHRNLIHFQTLDLWLHQCVFDRKYSNLPILKAQELKTKPNAETEEKLNKYLTHLSEIIGCNTSGSQIFCAPVLHWLELDNHGRNLVAHALGDVADINIPAVAAARVVRRYQAQDEDELSLNVGDMVSIIEMTTNGWWRGKQGLKVGSFPSQCVKRISRGTDIDGTHQRTFSPPKAKNEAEENMPISRKHGKFMFRLRSFLDTRPSKSLLKKRGIFRERVFGCDLGEHLHRTGEEVPTVVSDCTKFIEKHGLVDGIYRIPGVASHVRHLKYEFDSDKRPDLERVEGLPELSASYALADGKVSMCDPHSVAGLCKLYFRELPNPLLTYQLYDRFASALTDYEAEERLLKVYDAIQHLPPPHYRTLKHLVTHLRVMAGHNKLTSMHSRNLAIVWAPNLLRSRDIEAGLAALTEARVQSVVAEFIIVNSDLLFSEKLQNKQFDAVNKPPRPRSLMILPAPKLISLEEAQARSKSGMVSPVLPDSTSPSRVEMREWPDKSTTERRKRRHKKSTSVSIAYNPNSSQSVRGSRKQGLRYTRSVYDPNFSGVKSFDLVLDGPPSTKPTQGWKTRLGSILKKSSSPVQATVPCEVTLRRTQSADSLVSSHSFKKQFRNSDPLIDYKKTLSESSTTTQINVPSKKSTGKSSRSEKSHPERQLSRARNRSVSPARLRSKSRSPPKTRRSATVTDEKNSFPVKRRETFQITFRKVNSRSKSGGHDLPSQVPPRVHVNTAANISPDKEHSPNPFAELSCDFPTIMGESGLGFDPMKYQSSPNKSPLWHDVVVPPFRPTDEESDSRRQPQNKKLPNSVQPAETLSSDMVLAPVPPPMIADDAKPSSGPCGYLNEPQTDAKERLLIGNQNANNNNLDRSTRLNSPRKSSSKISNKSTDPIHYKKATKKTARETKTKTKLIQKLEKSPDNRNVPLAVHQIKTDHCRPISLQAYNVTETNPLKRDAHYGSFIALVGSPGAATHPVVPPTASTPENPSNLNKAAFKPFNVDPCTLSVDTPRSYKDERLSHALQGSAIRQQLSRENSSRRLDTFNPEGKQRQGYKETVLSPRYDSARGSMSGSIDSDLSSTFDDSLNRDNTHETGNNAKFFSNRPQPPDPRPAPRQHVRSFSVDDELLERHEDVQFDKPTPLPRLSQLAPTFGLERHSVGYAFDNRTYESWKQARSKSYSDDEMLTSRDSACLRKMKVKNPSSRHGASMTPT